MAPPLTLTTAPPLALPPRVPVIAAPQTPRPSSPPAVPSTPRKRKHVNNTASAPLPTPSPSPSPSPRKRAKLTKSEIARSMKDAQAKLETTYDLHYEPLYQTLQALAPLTLPEKLTAPREEQYRRYSGPWRAKRLNEYLLAIAELQRIQSALQLPGPVHHATGLGGGGMAMAMAFNPFPTPTPVLGEWAMMGAGDPFHHGNNGFAASPHPSSAFEPQHYYQHQLQPYPHPTSQPSIAAATTTSAASFAPHSAGVLATNLPLALAGFNDPAMATTTTHSLRANATSPPSIGPQDQRVNLTFNSNQMPAQIQYPMTSFQTPTSMPSFPMPPPAQNFFTAPAPAVHTRYDAVETDLLNFNFGDWMQPSAEALGSPLAVAPFANAGEFDVHQQPASAPTHDITATASCGPNSLSSPVPAHLQVQASPPADRDGEGEDLQQADESPDDPAQDGPSLQLDGIDWDSADFFELG